MWLSFKCNIIDNTRKSCKTFFVNCKSHHLCPATWKEPAVLIPESISAEILRAAVMRPEWEQPKKPEKTRWLTNIFFYITETLCCVKNDFPRSAYSLQTENRQRLNYADRIQSGQLFVIQSDCQSQYDGFTWFKSWRHICFYRQQISPAPWRAQAVKFSPKQRRSGFFQNPGLPESFTGCCREYGTNLTKTENLT